MAVWLFAAQKAPAALAHVHGWVCEWRMAFFTVLQPNTSHLLPTIETTLLERAEELNTVTSEYSRGL